MEIGTVGRTVHSLVLEESALGFYGEGYRSSKLGGRKEAAYQEVASNRFVFDLF